MPRVVPGLVRCFSADAGGGHGVGAGKFGRKFGEAEVENFGNAACGDENIGGLDVSVDDALVMGGLESVSYLAAEFFYFIDSDRFFVVEEMLESLAFEQFHGDEHAAVGFVDFVDGADVGVIERGGGARFSLETLDGLRLVRQFRRGEISGRRGGRVLDLRLRRRCPCHRRRFF